MTSGRKLQSRMAAPGLALLLLLTLGAEAPLAAQRKAQPTGEPPARSAGPQASARGSSSSSKASATRTATPRSAARRADTGRKAVDTRRSTPATRSRHRHSGGYRHYRGHHLGLHFGYYGHYGYGGYWGPYYYHPYYYPFYWGAPYYVPRRARTQYDLGALDLNVRPKKAEVYLDGQYIGPVREFDGWPGYLWLEGGSYELIFYRPGYATEVRNLTVYPGVVVDVHLRMQPGESLPPDQLTRAERAGPVEEARSAYEAQKRERAPVAPAGETGELDARTAPGRVRLSIQPADASVYLDGRFLGSGEDLGRLHAGLVVDAGSHLLEVVRPGYGSKRVEFTVDEGAEVKLDVLLESG